MSKRIRRGKFFNSTERHWVDPGYELRSTREELEYEGYPVYFGWRAVPENLVSASKARKQKLTVSTDPVGYCEDEFHWLTALYEVQV